ncbi:MAG: ribulokinase, partial [Oscillospiraceae bacterium]
VVGGYFKNITDASKTIARIDEKIYIPISENVRIYDKLYSEYKQLHDYFGRGENNILKRLKEIKKGANL